MPAGKTAGAEPQKVAESGSGTSLSSRLPVLRNRRRYMIFELEAEDEIQAKDLMNEIHSKQFSLFGDKGASENRLKLIAFNGRYGLLRFHHTHSTETRAILATIYSCLLYT